MFRESAGIAVEGGTVFKCLDDLRISRSQIWRYLKTSGDVWSLYLICQHIERGAIMGMSHGKLLGSIWNCKDDDDNGFCIAFGILKQAEEAISCPEVYNSEKRK